MDPAIAQRGDVEGGLPSGRTSVHAAYLVRDKGTLVAEAGDWIRRMQKSLDPGKLAKLRDRHCRKSEAEIAEQLTGHWREDHLFSLSRGLENQWKGLGEYRRHRSGDDADAGERARGRSEQLCNGKEVHPVFEAGSEPTHQRGQAFKKKKRMMTSTRVSGALRMATQSMRKQLDRPGRVLPLHSPAKRRRRAIFATAHKLTQTSTERYAMGRSMSISEPKLGKAISTTAPGLLACFGQRLWL